MSSRIVTLLAFACAALYGIWFFTTHERVTGAEYTGYTGAARYNELLAAELLLTELGHEAESYASLDASQWLPEVTDTIVARLSVQLGSAESGIALIDWLEQGGHLVLLPPEQNSTATDDFLWRLGFSFAEPTAISADNYDDASEGADEVSDYNVNRVAIRFNVETRGNVQGAATLTAGGDTIVARRAFGNGYVTVVGGSYFINPQLDEMDHGKLLLDVVSGYITSGKVWLIYDEAFPALWELIVANIPFVAASAAALVLLWLWSVIPKFGPRVAIEHHERRSIIEHIDATGAFSWRHRSEQGLVGAAVNALLHAAERRHPGIGRLAPKDQARLLASITGHDAQDILDVLTQGVEHRPRDFVRRIRTLQTIRNEL
ncbi:MAG: DUF4350 domain-containing protein [Pseudomonadota bacterium]